MPIHRAFSPSSGRRTPPASARRAPFGPALLAAAILAALLLPAASPAAPGRIEITLAPKTGVLPIVQIPAMLPIPLGPEPVETIKARPSDLGAGALYGILPNGTPDGALSIAVLRRPDGSEEVIVDLNDNEDLTDDQRHTWSGSYGPAEKGMPTLPTFATQIRRTCPAASAPVDIAVTFRRYEKDKAGGRAAVGLTNGIVANLDTYTEGTMRLGAKTYKVALMPVQLAGADSPFSQPGTAIIFDVNGDGQLDGHPFRGGERFNVGAPFVIDGQGYKVAEASCDGRRVVLTPVDAAALAAARPQQPAAPQTPGAAPAPGQRAPDFALTTIEGDSIRLRDYRGKVVLLDFWATWCGPCRMEMPYVKAAFERYHKLGLEVIGVSLDNTPTEVRAYTKMGGMPWPQILQGRGTMTRLKQDYGIRSIPAAFLIDQKGIVAATHPRGEGLLAAIENLLGDGS
jgi:peroxiredoxin